MKQSKVALVRCESYEQEKVDEAVRQAVSLLGGFEQIFAAAKGKNAALCQAFGGARGTLTEVSENGESKKLAGAADAGDNKALAEAADAGENKAQEDMAVAGECGARGACLNRDSRLVLKPNLLAKTPPEKACTTHPAVFRAAGKLLQEAGYANLTYGDSPGNPMMKVEKVAEGCGIKGAADSLGIPLGDFEHGVRVEFPQGRAADHFIVCNEVLEADGIINLCKMKTHQLERITGAVKNTFGCVFGVNKASSHARFATAETFAKMIADLNALVSPVLHIMDGIVAMEGNGPQGGTPKTMHMILASSDPVALDGLFCHLVHLNPALVPTNVAGMEQGAGSYENLQVVTEEGLLSAEEAAARYGDKSFCVQRGREYRGRLNAVRFLSPFLEKKPVVKEGKCVGCGICVQACPVEGKAIHLGSGGGFAGSEASGKMAGEMESGGAGEASGKDEKRRAERLPGGQAGGQGRLIARYDYSKCIKCYCCQEMCPQDAIAVKKSLLARIADREWRI